MHTGVGPFLNGYFPSKAHLDLNPEVYVSLADNQSYESKLENVVVSTLAVPEFTSAADTEMRGYNGKIILII